MQILRRTNLRGYRKALELGQLGIVNLIKEKGLTGRGGGGFSTGTKWEMVMNAPSGTQTTGTHAKRDTALESDASPEKYIICNADEGEPGTFKDKFILTKNPELVIEGILIAALAINAKKAFIYLRGEYEYLESKLKRVIKTILKKTKSKIEIEIVLGQGAYVCGDETAIIESIEGFRGQPRHKPPFPTTKGLYNKPTIINNVETLANVPLAILFKTWNKDLRLYSLSGDVKKPGLYELPLGTKLCDLVKLGRPKNKIKAVYFGCFGGCLPHCDIPLTPEDICGKECMHGAGTIIAVDETRSIVDMATNIAKFFEFESCGKCTPCREGTMRILALLQNISIGKAKIKDLNTLQELAEVIKESSFCGLGQTATNHLLTALKYFRKEFEEKCK